MRALVVLSALPAILAFAPSAVAQGSTQSRASATALTLQAARDSAIASSADIRAAAAVVDQARARARQASAWLNPSFTYGREQTRGGGQANSQHIAAFEQPIERPAVRDARREAALARVSAAEARRTAAEMEVRHDVARAYALAVSRERHLRLAATTAAAFAQAVTTSDAQLAAGDISGYAARRLRLESARYSALHAQAQLAHREARLTLASLLSRRAEDVAARDFILSDSLSTPETVPPLALLLDVAATRRADVVALEADVRAAMADAQQADRERTPIPVLSGGFKSELAAGVIGRMNGLVAGVSLPLPLWDRRLGVVEAATADVQQRRAETESLRRRVIRDVTAAYDAWHAVREQLATLAPHLGDEGARAVQAARVAYTEGEITLVEWLDAMRAYQESTTIYETLRAEAVIRLAALERAVGAPLDALNASSRETNR